MATRVKQHQAFETSNPVVPLRPTDQPAQIIKPAPAKTDATTGIYTITPHIAENWLKSNYFNRTLNNARVQMLAEDIKRGDWKLNGESIKFTREGALFDGQHRLKAIIKADTSIQSAVIFNLDPDSFDTLDVGMKRTPTQLFGLAGEPYPLLTASLTHLYLRYRIGIRGFVEKQARAVSFQMQRRILNEHPDMRETIELVGARQHHCRGGRAVPALVHYLAKKKHGMTAAREFICQLYAPQFELAEYSMTSPIRLLHEVLTAPKRRVMRWSQEAVLAYYIPAWNAYIRNQRVRSLTPLNWDVASDADLKLA